ncbi:multiubiquitin domain-containing protein [Bradyrhizobium sp. CCBAU 11445]|uniref:multiubiquitin domain-containing protein n=1 Tax=Bradyrhizobium sp. CCBAU 11445 TaxID=1630896 RepID=UPI0023055E8E|nr:multiubiquitin domain-containing protein [Bradyrhizobium sp. CCBAU 11445]
MNTHIVPGTPEAEVVVVEGRGAGEVLVEVEVFQDHGREVVVIDIVDIEECGRDNRPPPHAHRYKVKIDHDYFVFDRRFVTGRELLERAGKTPVTKYELEKRMHGGHYVAIGLDEKVDLGEHGIEVFETFPLDETEG